MTNDLETYSEDARYAAFLFRLHRHQQLVDMVNSHNQRWWTKLINQMDEQMITGIRTVRPDITITND